MKIFSQPTCKYPKREAGFTSTSIEGTPEYATKEISLLSWLRMMFLYKVWMRFLFWLNFFLINCFEFYWKNPRAWDTAKRAEYWAFILFILFI